jgi:hypothetical protein
MERAIPNMVSLVNGIVAPESTVYSDAGVLWTLRRPLRKVCDLSMTSKLGIFA